jgi:hypothetical protein
VRLNSGHGRRIRKHSSLEFGERRASVFNQRHALALQSYLSQDGTDGPLSPLGEYLKERGFIVPRGTHEYRQFLTRFGEQHYRTDTLELILLASEDCDLRCKYCYEDFKRGTMLPSVRRNVKAGFKGNRNHTEFRRALVWRRAPLRSKIKGELVRTRRLPECVEFFETDAHTALSRTLGDIAPGLVSEPLLLIAGDRTYYGHCCEMPANGKENSKRWR